jgi:hypothetical protein
VSPVEVHPGMRALTLKELLRPQAHFRAAHLALPAPKRRMTVAELEASIAALHARIDELERGATS